MKRRILLIGMITMALILMGVEMNFLEAQCAMCKAAGEASLKEGTLDARGLNKGIIYMLSIPYVLVCLFGFFWWKNRKKESEV